MEDRFLALAAAGVAVAGISGCSSPSSPPQPPGALPPLTAHVTIDGKDAGTVAGISCSQVGQYFTIETGNEQSGVTAVVESINAGEKLAAKSVEINNLAGFTGSYWDGLDVGKADAKVTGNTYTITGTAAGFNTAKPDDDVEAQFQVRAGC